MCTTGARILRPGHEVILFKNRDFKRQQFEDRVVLSDEAFGVLGLETWDGADPQADRFSGFSIGFNRHLICCDSNVQSVPGGENYDQLVQVVVENCASIDEAVECVHAMVQAQTFCWANLLVATPDGLAALEVREHQVVVERQPTMIARANHHVCLGAHPNDDDTSTTPARWQSAAAGLEAVSDLEAVFKLLRAHEPELPAQHLQSWPVRHRLQLCCAF